MRSFSSWFLGQYRGGDTSHEDAPKREIERPKLKLSGRDVPHCVQTGSTAQIGTQIFLRVVANSLYDYGRWPLESSSLGIISGRAILKEDFWCDATSDFDYDLLSAEIKQDRFRPSHPRGPMRRAAAHCVPKWMLAKLRESGDLIIRTTLPEDREQMRLLYSEWFPPEYDDCFFDVAASTDMNAVRRDFIRADMVSLSLIIPTGTYEMEAPGIHSSASEQYHGWVEPRGGIKDDFFFKRGIAPRGHNWDGNRECGTLVVKSHILLGHCVLQTKLRAPNDYDFDSSLACLSPELRGNMREQMKAESAYVLSLGVSDNAEGLGLGRDLLSACIAGCKTINPGLNTIFLHVVGYNEAAVQFYEKQGFMYLDSIPGYYFFAGASWPADIYYGHLR